MTKKSRQKLKYLSSFFVSFKGLSVAKNCLRPESESLKNKIYKYSSSISKNVYIDKFHDIVDKYNSTYHTAIKMKPIDVNSSTYIDFNRENNKEDLKFEVGGYVRISKY